MSSNNTYANCGKGKESGILKACMSCKLVKYCNRVFQIAHRPQHKKQCERRVVELHDEKLFKQPPPLDDCPICFLRMPSLGSGRTYMSCCGNLICDGCVHAADLRDKKNASLCPFCRTPPPITDEEVIERYEKRMELNDARAIHRLGAFYANGELGLPQSMTKALELWHRAGELGHNYNGSYCNIGNVYNLGVYVEKDIKKAVHYWELAAMGGNTAARHNLGVLEKQGGNVDRALKHWMIAVECGFKKSLEIIKRFYNAGQVTEDDYAKALRLYQAYLDEIKSDQRDEAAAFNADWKYID